MKTPDRIPILFLERVDLIRWVSELEIEKISVSHFKAYVYPMILKSNKVIFLDGENEKVLKERYVK